MKRPEFRLRFRLVVAVGIWLSGSLTAAAGDLDKLTFHVDAQRSGWNRHEKILTPQAVASAAFGRLWSSPRFDAVGSVPARLFASPLYLDRVPVPGFGRGTVLSVVYAAATTGYVYAVNAVASRQAAAGAILWHAQLTRAPCGRGALGILATPVIDRQRTRLYVTACDQPQGWSVHALDLGSGRELPGWPLALSAQAINRPGINANGNNQFPAGVANLQRGALNLSPDDSRLYITFGGEPVSGWLLEIDTRLARVASAFSATSSTDEGVGGMWASGGAALDAQGMVYVSTGSSVVNALAGRGIDGVYPDRDANWSQSILKLGSSASGGLHLLGTYTPFDYCQAGSRDLDLGSSSPVLVDLPGGSSGTTHLLALGGSKQGNAYLLDRDHFPGSLKRRQPCGENAARDGSLLAPNPQPQFGGRGPLNVFGPYSASFGMGDRAKSRSTSAYYQGADGQHYLYVSGSAKAGENSVVSVAPGLVRLRIVAKRKESAWLKVDRSVPGLVLQNPGSPVISSDGLRDAIVWLLDENQPRSASLYGKNPPAPVLYAVDASSGELLWQSAPGELYPSGKYNEPAIVGGRVFVGTDRIQAYGLRFVSSMAEPTPSQKDTGVDSDNNDATNTGEQTPGNDHSSAATTARAAVDAGPIYLQRCSACHDVVREGVPLRIKLMGLTEEAIVDKLKFGSMQPQALGLDDAAIASLAHWLTTQ